MKIDQLALNSGQDHLEARFALRLAARLNEGAEALPHDVTQRLRVARQQALQRAALARTASIAPATPLVRGWNWVMATAGGPSMGQNSPPWWARAAALLPLVVLVAGLLGIQELHALRMISAAAEIDTALLADDLPPGAYQDAGFLEFLKRPPLQE